MLDLTLCLTCAAKWVSVHPPPSKTAGSLRVSLNTCSVFWHATFNRRKWTHQFICHISLPSMDISSWCLCVMCFQMGFKKNMWCLLMDVFYQKCCRGLISPPGCVGETHMSLYLKPEKLRVHSQHSSLYLTFSSLNIVSFLWQRIIVQIADSPGGCKCSIVLDPNCLILRSLTFP